MERSKAATKEKEVQIAYHYLIKMYNSQHNIVVFHKIWKKYNEIQLTKNKMDLNNRIMKNHPPSPAKKVKL